MTAGDRIPHPSERGPAYAIARRFLDYSRQLAAYGRSPRAHDAIRLAGGRTALSNLAADLGYGAGLFALASDTLKEHPLDAGPLWLHEAALDLERRLEARRQAGRP